MSDKNLLPEESRADDSLSPLSTEATELPMERRDEPAGEFTLISEKYSGPLPHPNILKGYEETIPGAAERILILLEEQQAHRIKMDEMELSSVTQIEHRRLEAGIQRDRVGMFLGFILALVLIAFSTYAISLGYAPQSAGLLAWGIATLAGVFAYSRYSGQKEMREQREALQSSATAPQLPENTNTD